MNTTVNYLSDGISVSLRVSDRSWAAEMVGLLRLVAGAGFIWTTCLARGFPVRGGLDIGVGVEAFNTEVVGAALVRAYRLEHVTKTPRIRIAIHLSNVVDSVLANSENTPEQRLAQGTARALMRMLRRDEDGLLQLDPLSPDFVRLYEQNGSQALLQEGVKRVKSAISRKASIQPDVYEKYEWLASYMQEQVGAYWSESKIN